MQPIMQPIMQPKQQASGPSCAAPRVPYVLASSCRTCVVRSACYSRVSIAAAWGGGVCDHML